MIMHSQRLLAGVRAVFFDAVGTLITPDPRAPAVYAAVGRLYGSRLDVTVVGDRFRAAFRREERRDRAARWRTDRGWPSGPRSGRAGTSGGGSGGSGGEKP